MVDNSTRLALFEEDGGYRLVTKYDTTEHENHCAEIRSDQHFNNGFNKARNYRHIGAVDMAELVHDPTMKLYRLMLQSGDKVGARKCLRRYLNNNPKNKTVWGNI